MSFFKWIIRSLVFYRRMHLAAALAGATATAALTGALLTGDSVKATLEYALDARLGSADRALFTQERFFTEELSRRLEKHGIETAPVIHLRGMVTSGDGTVRVNQVRVLGVNDRFFDMSPAKKSPAVLEDGAALVNSALAGRLNISETQDTEIVLRIDNPSAVSRNLVLAPFKGSTISMRMPVTGVADDDHFGRFNLEADQREPFNIFVPLTWLQKQIERHGTANLMLISDLSEEHDMDNLNAALNSEWHLKDAEAEIKIIEKGIYELNTSRVFIDEAIGGAALKAQPGAIRLLTYFVNELRIDDAFTPYSMVTAAEKKGDFTGIFPHDMTDDQIVINEWLAEDLNAKAGDILTLRYYVPGEWQTLKEAQRSFTVSRIILLEGAALDRSLTPHIPGLTDSESCSEWDPSLPIDLNLIRDKDEAYWDKHRGTPKAFVTLAAGQAMWANSYGDLTAVRFQNATKDPDTIAEDLREFIDPADLGLSSVNVRETGKTASRGGTDFGQLFLGLSVFLIVSGIMLTWLLFVFSIEGRRSQTGMLKATGFTVNRIRKLYLFEGLSVAFIGSLLGIVIALIYTRALVWGLSNAWQGAVAGMTVLFFASPLSLLTGFISGFLISSTAMIWTLHRQMKASAHSLLSGSEACSGKGAGRFRMYEKILPVISFSGAVLLIIISGSPGSSAMAGVFFGAGALLLISIMALINIFLKRLGRKSNLSLESLSSLALRNSARRKGRSMAVIAMLACGVFMIVAVGANRRNPEEGSEQRKSGTGGFALYAESSIPVVQDINTISGQETWGIDGSITKGSGIVNIRVRDGDDASCLNLNRTQEPRITGISSHALAERDAFSFQEMESSEYSESPWEILKQDFGERAVPAIGDYPTIYWGLGMKVGDTLTYRNRAGEEIHLRIAGMIRSSILQGSLIIDEEAMSRYFPEVEGYRAWLIDAPHGKGTALSEHLTQRMTDAGLSVTTAVERLEIFNRMEDTYLSIFLVLGGLGLMLGCIGLGLIVARNLLERQGELAMLRALGFNKGSILRIVCYEHLYLLAGGLLAGIVCALVAVIPSIRAAAGQIPIGLLIIMSGMIGLSGLAWVVVSAVFSLRGNLLIPLRNE